MRARHEIALSVGLLALVLLAIGFGTVGLLARMAPAIGVILRENDASLRASEAMLAVLAHPDKDAAVVALFTEHLEFAESNVTVVGERDALARLRAVHVAALRGEVPARRAAVEALEALSRLNRASMSAADTHARRLGVAGAWTAVILSLFGAGAALLVVRRLQRRLIAPIDELHATLQASGEGDTLRRCRIQDAPVELLAVRNAINALLDRERPAPAGDAHGTPAECDALIALLDERPAPTWVMGHGGALHACNRSGLELLAFEPSLRETLGQLAGGGAPPPGFVVRHLPSHGASGGAWIIERVAADSGPTPGPGA